MSTSVPSPAAPHPHATWRAWIVPVGCVLGWLVIYSQLQRLADTLMRWLQAATGLAPRFTAMCRRISWRI